MRPAFREGGTVTAGNASTLNDGAACLVLASEQMAAELGATPLARVVATGVAGVDPAVMGIGPIPAIRRALAAAGLELEQIDLIEINEAFAAQVLACAASSGSTKSASTSTAARSRSAIRSAARAPGCSPRSPGSCDGAAARYGIAALCVGVGQGLATVIEAV